jgi:hypothetical protein
MLLDWIIPLKELSGKVLKNFSLEKLQ